MWHCIVPNPEAETKPSQACALARGFECAFLKRFSLASEVGVQVVEAARQLHSLDVVRCVVTSVAELEYLPKLTETVASFSAQDVAAMCTAVCSAWEKHGDYTVRDHLPSNRVNLVASLLDGVKDPERITHVLDAVAIEQKNDGGECEADEYARVLLLASRVSLDRARTLLCEKDVTSFLHTVLPATVLMAESCESDDWDAVRPVASYVIDWLTANAAMIKNAPYVAVVVKCGNCPYCDCSAVKKFLSSDADSKVLTARQTKRLAGLELGDLIKMEPTTGKPGAMLATKTCESKAVDEMQKQLEALREAVAKRTQ